LKSLILAFCLAASPAIAADLPASYASPSRAEPACTFLVPTIYGGLTCAGLQYGGGSPNTPGPIGTHTVTVHTPPSPPPSPPGDPCGDKGGGKHGGHHGEAAR
jgi:hypothetical protein